MTENSASNSAETTAESTPGFGRYAPSPSGDLHLGNLRTAVLAYLFALHTGRGFRMRIDDIDAQRSSAEAAERQLEDLAALGIEWDPPVATQQQTVPHYQRALDTLAAQGLVYECYCSRKDIQEAARAPHAIPGTYPGTCRDLTEQQRAAKRAELDQQGRVPSLRLRAGVDQWAVTELFSAGATHAESTSTGATHAESTDRTYTGDVDDMVLRRGGNANQASDADFAYNLAVVVDDHLAGIDQVVRGDDLLSSAPRQAYLAHLLGFAPVEYIHVPLVLGPNGKRLAKRDGAVTLRELVPGADLDTCARAALEWIGKSLGCGLVASLKEIAERFDPAALPKHAVTWRPQ